jgi:hypothetical protein
MPMRAITKYEGRLLYNGMPEISSFSQLVPKILSANQNTVKHRHTICSEERETKMAAKKYHSHSYCYMLGRCFKTFGLSDSNTDICITIIIGEQQ